MSLKPPSSASGPSLVWVKPDGDPVSCVEKIKVLNDNYQELRQLAQDALDDALLMGCSEKQVRAILCEMVNTLIPNYPEQEK